MKIFAVIAVYFMTLAVMPAFAQTTEFTYQGKLNVAGTPATSYDLEFRLCATETESCSPPLAVFAQTGVSISSSGIFSVGVNFGFGVFNGSERYIEVSVRRTGETSYTTLSPRQRLTSVPYAQQSLNATFFDSRSLEDFVLENDPRLQPNYAVLNTTTLQPSVNFNVGGTGTASILNAATQFNLGGDRILGGAAGTDNLFAGRNSGAANSGTSNSFFGTNSGRLNVANNNSFFGFGSGEINSTGVSNSFFGGGSGASNTNGRLNSFFGVNAGISNTQGDDNAFFGVGSGLFNATGGNNTFIGSNVGTSNVSGGNNTLIGSGANVGSSDLTYATAIGTRAFAAQSNSIILGSINGVNGATADTRVGIGVTAPTSKLQIVDRSNAGLRVQTNATGGTVASFGSNGAFQVDAPSVAGGRLIILENGNVGIGDAAPTARLSVTGATSTSTAFEINSGTMRIDSEGVSGGRLSILENGNVGIGNASPQAKLSISGAGTTGNALEINNGGIRVTGAGFDTQTAVFKIEKNASNTCGQGRRTVIDNLYSNNNPNAVVFVTPVAIEPLQTEFTFTVYYATSTSADCGSHLNKWVIISDQFVDTVTVRFNVMIIRP